MRLQSLMGALSVALVIVAASARANESFGGIGIALAQLYDSSSSSHRGELVVLHVIEETPAASSGIRQGDVITHVDGEATGGVEFEQLILTKLRGPVGSKIELTIKRYGSEGPLTFTVSRTEITHRSET